MRIRQVSNGYLFDNGAGAISVHETKADALRALAASAEFRAITAAGAVLDERWVTREGLAFSEDTGDGRDFAGCAWSWRDPAESLLPLMLQTETEFGHFGAELAGWFEELHMNGTTPDGSGRFYDNEMGRQFRDMLKASGFFGVSVDPGPATEVEFTCTEEDDEGWCIDGVATFTAYEIIGATGTPFPAFARAAVMLEGSDAKPETEQEEQDTPDSSASVHVLAPEAVAAGQGSVTRLAPRGAPEAPQAPPAAWMAVAEPELGSPLLVDQGDGVNIPFGTWAVPLQITDEGQVFGHLAFWGQCHVGFADVCISPPMCQASYRGFHIGTTELEDGTKLATGNLLYGTDHPPLSFNYGRAVDHYAHTGAAWAAVRASNGIYGPWVCGTLLPGIAAPDLTVLRASGISGDWRWLDGGLELCAALSVPSPGFPVAREALAASSKPLGHRRAGHRTEGDHLVALTAANVVRRQCSTCGKASTMAQGADDQWRAQVSATLSLLERRTRPLLRDAVVAAAARVGK